MEKRVLRQCLHKCLVNFQYITLMQELFTKHLGIKLLKIANVFCLTVVSFTVGIWWLCVFLRQDFQESGWCLICPTVAWCLSWISIGAAFHPAIINPSYRGSGTGSIDETSRLTDSKQKRSKLFKKKQKRKKDSDDDSDSSDGPQKKRRSSSVIFYEATSPYDSTRPQSMRDSRLLTSKKAVSEEQPEDPHGKRDRRQNIKLLKERLSNKNKKA